MQTAAAARKERRRRERLEKKGQEAAHRAACFLARLLHKERIKTHKIELQPTKAPALFRWGLWEFVLEGKGFYSKLYGFHPKYGWWHFCDYHGGEISQVWLEKAGFKLLEEAGTNA
jgi:hypothetical protein